jgi:hypothetical protein
MFKEPPVSLRPREELDHITELHVEYDKRSSPLLSSPLLSTSLCRMA